MHKAKSDKNFKTANRKVIDIENRHVNSIGYDDLLKNKKESGQPRDIEHT